MKTIRIKFVGFWEEWNPNDNFIINALKKVSNPELSDDPEVLFSSCFSDEYMDYDCVRVFYTGENICPDFNEFDYAIGFEEMDFGDRYVRYPLYLVEELYGDDYARMLNKHNNVEGKISKKTDFCSFVVSNGTSLADDIRKDFFYRLSEYKRVNSGGKYLNNIGEPEGVANKLEFQQRHKFAIAFENSSHPGYITEKLIQAYAANTVPIYYGDINAKKYFSKESYIDCSGYNSLDEVVEAIKCIDEDDLLYKKMLSTPALIEHNHKEIYDDRLVEFLEKIVNQSDSDAYRTNRIRYDRAYFDKKREMQKIYERHMVSISQRVKNKIKRIIK